MYKRQIWKSLLLQLGIEVATTTAYHPQANGLVERMHRQLKAALKARLTDGAWMDELPIVLLGLRSAWREGPDTTPSELLYGESLRLPGQLIPGVGAEVPAGDQSCLPSFFRKMRALAPVPSSHHAVHPCRVPPSLSSASYVYIRHDAVRRPLQRPYDGPFLVTKRGEKTFTISKQGQPYTVSDDR